MILSTAPYREQVNRWPKAGRHVMAHFDDATVVVYQAYRAAIADYAVTHQSLGGEFSFARMSWIKPNFLWMMYRCGWATKENQERVLAIALRCDAFNQVLGAAVPSTFDSRLYSDDAAWRDAVARSDVRLQWDPDHDPAGAPVDRRAIQLGLRGEALQQFAGPWITSIQDITEFVLEQRVNAHDPASLIVPIERAYPVEPSTAARIGLDVRERG